MKHLFRVLGKVVQREPVLLWAIEGEENQHLYRVLRKKENDKIEVFDGNGSFSEAVILDISKNSCLAEASCALKTEEEELKRGLVIGALKKQTMEDLLPSLVELGVNEVHVFGQEKTAKFLYSDKITERYEKIILNAAKQAKRNFLPKLFVWEALDPLLVHLDKVYESKYILMKDADILSQTKKMYQKSLCAIVGSEAGLADNEVNRFLEIGATSFSIGPHTLRAFTAAIGACALLESLNSNK